MQHKPIVGWIKIKGDARFFQPEKGIVHERADEIAERDAEERVRWEMPPRLDARP